MIKYPLEFLQGVTSYLLSHRKVGKTMLVKNGTARQTTPFYVLTEDEKRGEQFTKDNPNCIVLTPNTIHKSEGTTHPLVVDQEIFLPLFESVSSEFNQYRLMMEKTMTLAEYYQNRCHTIEDLAVSLSIIPWWLFWKRKKVKKKIRDHIKAGFEKNPLKEILQFNERRSMLFDEIPNRDGQYKR